ncbi:DUF2919 family protein [Salmonella enterica]
MMLRHSSRKAGDYDDNGLLKVPVVFWCGVLLQTRVWWLTGLGMASEHGGLWLSLLYPDTTQQLTGLVASVPALAVLFCYPVRGHLPLLAKGIYLLMLFAVAVLTAGDVLMLAGLLPGEQETGWLSVCPDLACLVMLWPDKRLREVFFTDKE